MNGLAVFVANIVKLLHDLGPAGSIEALSALIVIKALNRGVEPWSVVVHLGICVRY